MEQGCCDVAQSADQRYRALFDQALDTITVLTLEGVIVEVNERWRDVTGTDPASMVGRHIRDFVVPEHEEEVVGRYLRSGRRRSCSVPLRHADGRTVHLEFSTSVMTLDGQPRVLSIGRDVSERVAAEARLAAAEERYRSLVERMPDVVFTTRHDGRLVFVTPNVSEICGLRAEEVIASGAGWWREHVHPEDVDALRHAYRAFATERGALDLEIRWRRGDAWIWVRARGIATYVRDGRRYVDGLLSDVSEKKRLEQSFRLAQKMEAIGQLTGGIAHDFNNILTAILANAHFLLEDLPDTDPRRVDADEIRVAAERAAALTRQLLTFSRPRVLELRTVDLDATVSGLEKMLRRLIGEDVRLVVQLDVRCGTVRVDVGQLEQVIMNLVVNARDAMPNGGQITIETSCVELDGEAAMRRGVEPGPYAKIIVRDTGIGMDEETQARIFEPFFTTKGPGRGTGLGLTTCYGIVHQSGGSIDIESELGRGATFAIHLPTLVGSPLAERSSETAPVQTATETVLLVEDERLIRNAVQRVLEDCGYSVLAARDGAEARAVAVRHPGSIDLILSDVVMPGESGPEIVAWVQAEFPETKALLMSGHTTHPMLTDAAAQGRFHFLQKPFSPGALTRKVREALEA